MAKTPLKDAAARRVAMLTHDRSLLVEAGAGSGKTAIMAGRVALLLAEGVAPRAIAAVTFTELAASELLQRVREVVGELRRGHIAPELSVALPSGVSEAQINHLSAAQAQIDEIACTTIHGFCQRLIKPYPVEADIDPGATLIDPAAADLAFSELLDDWLRERLSGERDGVLSELVMRDVAGALDLIDKVARAQRHHRTLAAPSVSDAKSAVAAFIRASKAFTDFLAKAKADEPDSLARARAFEQMASAAGGQDVTTAAALVALLTAAPADELRTTNGFKAYQCVGKWRAAAKVAGLSKAEGEALNDGAAACYKACCESWTAVAQSAAGAVLAAVIAETAPLAARFRDFKRQSAQLDFDDLIFAARDLLRDHEAIRVALGRRYTHVLVDEFQDTDPLQTEIFWRLCGDPPAADADWRAYRIRPGALFLVGDPKQAIYRFRGADVNAYIDARAAFAKTDPDSILSITTNFRSRASILSFVNARFDAPLSGDGQPGFTALDAFHPDLLHGVAVAALDVDAADENGRASSERMRDSEADAVAELCVRLIGSLTVVDKRAGTRLCQPGDIALLAPTGADLWRYEEALEARGVPVATQAGKGFYRRQEVQDLIALTRVLADGGDRLALGALLRGPLVGLTDEELLDIVVALPRDSDDPSRIPALSIVVDLDHVSHPLAQDMLRRLQTLRRLAYGTTPHALLSQAVDMLRVRPILLARHRGQAERALANIDLFLNLAASYAVRGLRAFAEAMTDAWTDAARAVEGRPDAQADAVSLYTMHSAKGLEWPVVVPINTMTQVTAADTVLVGREDGVLRCKTLGVAPNGYNEARAAEAAEQSHERVRLWYVAATRARELLVLPRIAPEPGKTSWARLADLGLAELRPLDLKLFTASETSIEQAATNAETRAQFASAAAVIAAHRRELVWCTPSRAENTTIAASEEPAIWIDAESEPLPNVQGGRGRGLVLHKLFEEALTGETIADESALRARAAELIAQLGEENRDDPNLGLCAQELGACVARTLGLAQIAPLRPSLLPEIAVYAAETQGRHETAFAGIVDALTLTAGGAPDVVVDWKSDVNPTPAMLDHYHAQVQDYLAMTGARRGLIVLATTGRVVEIAPRASRSP